MTLPLGMGRLAEERGVVGLRELGLGARGCHDTADIECKKCDEYNRKVYAKLNEVSKNIGLLGSEIDRACKVDNEEFGRKTKSLEEQYRFFKSISWHISIIANQLSR